MTAPCAFDLTGPYAYDLHVQVLWVVGIVDVQAPTEAEIAIGVDLQAAYGLSDIVGWEVETAVVASGVWGPFDRERMTRQSVGDSRLLFPADIDGEDVRELWARGDVGNIVILPSGPYLEHPMAPINVYPVRVAQVTQMQRLRSGSGATLMVDFAVTARVGENVFVFVP